MNDELNSKFEYYQEAIAKYQSIHSVSSNQQSNSENSQFSTQSTLVFIFCLLFVVFLCLPVSISISPSLSPSPSASPHVYRIAVVLHGNDSSDEQWNESIMNWKSGINIWHSNEFYWSVKK